MLDNASLQALLADRKRIDQALRFCKRSIDNNKGVKVANARQLPKEEGLKLVDRLDALLEKENQLRATQASLEKDIAYMMCILMIMLNLLLAIIRELIPYRKLI